MAHSAKKIANEIWFRCKAKGGPTAETSNMKIQKLVYIAHGISLAFLNSPLIDDKVEAWKYGPVIPSLFFALKKYGSGDITNPITLHDSENSNLSKKEQELLDAVVDYYGAKTGLQLSALTHKRGTPWKKTMDDNQELLKWNVSPDIDPTIIRDYYKRIMTIT